MKCNGRRLITVKTIHGQFQFAQQRFYTPGEGEFSYLEYTGQLSGMSERLQEWVCYLANRMSYHEVIKELERVTGVGLLSAPGLQQLVLAKAQTVSQRQAQQVQAVLAQKPTLPKLSQSVNVYDPDSEEVLLLGDGVCVKRQKKQRPRSVQAQTRRQDEAKWVNTDVMMLQQPGADFTYLMTGLTEQTEPPVSLPDLVKVGLITAYGQAQEPLKLVAITDGARHMRLLLEQVVGQALTIILDWYHLRKKCAELMSMIARTKAEKATHLQTLLAYLWRGQTDQAVAYLKTEVVPRHVGKLTELVTYLDKHTSEIIDYQRRQQAGKPIGSGRMEKGVDLTVAQRQKRKGMSWSDLGSHALALLKTVELNGQWHTLWASCP